MAARRAMLKRSMSFSFVRERASDASSVPAVRPGTFRAAGFLQKERPRHLDAPKAMSQRGFYAGLFLITACTLMLQVVQTRILSVVAWYHLAFFAISMAMFGLTAGAVFVYLKRERFTLADTRPRLGLLQQRLRALHIRLPRRAAHARAGRDLVARRGSHVGPARPLHGRTFFLLRNRREPRADSQPISNRPSLRNRSARRGCRMSRRARIAECNGRAVGRDLDGVRSGLPRRCCSKATTSEKLRERVRRCMGCFRAGARSWPAS